MASYSEPFGRPHKRSALAAVSWKRSRLWGNTSDSASLVSCPSQISKHRNVLVLPQFVAQPRHQTTSMCQCFFSQFPGPRHETASICMCFLGSSCRYQTTSMWKCVLGSRTCWFGLRSILRGETIIAAPLLLLLNLELINFAFETLTPPCSCYWTNPAKLTRSGRACLKAGTAASTERQARTWACVREEVFFSTQKHQSFLPPKYTLGQIETLSKAQCLQELLGLET